MLSYLFLNLYTLLIVQRCHFTCNLFSVLMFDVTKDNRKFIFAFIFFMNLLLLLLSRILGLPKNVCGGPISGYPGDKR